MLAFMRVILASASPRRLEILRTLGIDPEVRPADIDESAPPDADPAELVRTLALRKAESVCEGLESLAQGKGAEGSEALVIGADTLVVVDGLILGKPGDPADAIAMLERLAGRSHHVATGLCLISHGPDGDAPARPDREPVRSLRPGRPTDGASDPAVPGAPPRAGTRPERSRILVDAATTEVRFRAMTEGEIRGYVATEEPMDKAGAYAIQGGAGRFVERIDGSYTNVVGFPVELFGEMLARLGLTVERLKRR